MDLDPIEQEFIANVARYLAGLEEMIQAGREFIDRNAEEIVSVEALQAAIDSMEGKIVEIRTVYSSQGFGENIDSLLALDRAWMDVARDSRALSDEMAATVGTVWEPTRASMAEVVGQANAVAEAERRVFAVNEEGTASVLNLYQATRLAAAGMQDTESASNGAAAAAAAAGAAAGGAGRNFRIWGTGVRLTGYGIHWLIAGTVEFLAVFIPALIAAGDAAMVMAEGFTWAKDRITAVYQSTEATAAMLHTSTGQVLGLKSALQQAQTTADPMVWELLGAGVNGVKDSFGGFWRQGLDVVHMLDTFAAHVDMSLGPGGVLGKQANTAIQSMVADLQGLGQVLGNFGHILLSLATSMPGIAEVILHTVAALTGFLNILLQIKGIGYLVTAFMALEELGRWGGLLLKITAPLATGIGTVGARLASMAADSIRAGGAFAKMAPAIAGAAGAAEKAGTAMAAAGKETENFWGAVMMPLTNPVGQVLLITGALVGLMIVMQNTKTAAQQMVSTMENTIGSETPVKGIVTMLQDLKQLQAASDSAGSAVVQLTKKYQGMTGSMRAGGAASMISSQTEAYNTYQQGIRNVVTQLGNLFMMNTRINGVNYDLATSIGLATAAGVHMNQMFDQQGRLSATATQMIKNLVTGYQMMAQTGTVLANDINAIDVQTLMQQTDVSKLNQAWDSFLSTVTGGTSALGSFNSDLTTIGNVALAATSKIAAFGQQSGGTALSVKQIGQALTSFSGTSAQVWQNYDAALTQAGQVTDWLRTAAAAGAVTSDQYKQSIKGVVSELLPYAKYSKTAVAELDALAIQAGGPTTTSFQTLTAWVGNTKDAQKNLNGTVNDATQQMANLSKVATNLSTTLNSEVDSALAQGAVNVKGIADAARNFSTQLHTGNMNTFAFVGSVAQMVKQLLLADEPLTSIKSVMDQLATKAGLSKSQIQLLNTQIDNLAKALGSIHDVNATVRVNEVISTPTGGRIGPPAYPGGMASGGRIPGYGGGDKHLALLEGGEAVVPKHLVKGVAPYLGAHGVPGFAKGGPVGDPGGGSEHQGPLGNTHPHVMTPMEKVLALWAKEIWHMDHAKYGSKGPIPLNIMEQIFGPRKFGKTGMWKNPQYVQLVTDEQADMHGYYLKDLAYWRHESDIKNIGKSEKKQIAIWEKDIATHYGAATEAKRMAQLQTELTHYEKKLKDEKDPYWRKIYEKDIARVEKELKAEPNYYRNKFLSDIANLRKIDAGKISKDKREMAALLEEMGYAKGGLIPMGTYDRGGYLPTGLSLAMNNTGRPEPVGHSMGGVTHVHMEIGGREIANAIVPDMVGSVNRYTYRNSGRATGILRPQ